MKDFFSNDSPEELHSKMIAAESDALKEEWAIQMSISDSVFREWHAKYEGKTDDGIVLAIWKIVPGAFVSSAPVGYFQAHSFEEVKRAWEWRFENPSQDKESPLLINKDGEKTHDGSDFAAFSHHIAELRTGFQQIPGESPHETIGRAKIHIAFLEGELKNQSKEIQLLKQGSLDMTVNHTTQTTTIDKK